MKLLILMPSFPSPTWGAGTRNYHILKALAAHHTVSLLCLTDWLDAEFIDAELYDLSLLNDCMHTVKFVVRQTTSKKRLQQLWYIARLRSYSIAINDSKQMQEALDTLLQEEHYDAVLFESVLVAGYRLPEGTRYIIDQHNIEYELLWRTFQSESSWLRKWYNWQESHLLRRAEIEICKKASLVLTTSERDCRSLKSMLPDNIIEVVPNGVDVELFQNSLSDEIPYQIIFTGVMNYYPNIDAVLSFARDCWPLIKAEIPQATWKIVGGVPVREVRKLAELPDVTVTGTVPDVRPYLAASAVAIAPVQVGSGTRLKILEAFAMRKAVVSTSIGCEGLSVVPGKHLLIADRPVEFAQAVVKLLTNPEMRTTLGNAGRALVEEKYSWEHCGTQLLRFLETHISEKDPVC
jgi:sugar transferase (PEP-CTERM/EpsH1 system associated)